MGNKLLLLVVGEDGPHAQDFLLDDKLAVCQLQDVVCSGQAHVIKQSFRELERLEETDLLLVGVVGETDGIDIHVIQVE